jgi:hypothetical protein
MNYEIIKDLTKLQQFIDWLPELLPHETYYISLLARNKYCKDIVHIKTDVQQLRRFTSDKSRLLSKIEQLQCELGTYKQRDLQIPQEALALYIHPNPRSQIVAAKATCRELLDVCLAPYSNYNVHQIALSKIQQSRSRKLYFDIDYDCLPLSIFITDALDVVINRDAVSILQTHGGFHALVNLTKIAKEFETVWYNGLKELAWEDPNVVSGDLLMPVPGCTQGNFIPYFLTIDGIEQ